MPLDSPNLWVGVLPKTGVLIVFDPALQIAGQSEIYVYSVLRNLVRKFASSEIRTKVRTIQGTQRKEALEKYAAWRTSEGRDFLQHIEAERVRVEAEANAKRAEIKAQHKAFIKARGHTYIGTTSGKPKSHRITHCWNCKDHLDNEVDIECLSCGWIICTCGACGCGRDS